MNRKVAWLNMLLFKAKQIKKPVYADVFSRTYSVEGATIEAVKSLQEGGGLRLCQNFPLSRFGGTQFPGRICGQVFCNGSLIRERIQLVLSVQGQRSRAAGDSRSSGGLVRIAVRR